MTFTPDAGRIAFGNSFILSTFKALRWPKKSTLKFPLYRGEEEFVPFGCALHFCHATVRKTVMVFHCLLSHHTQLMESVHLSDFAI